MRRHIKILIVFAAFCFAGNAALAQNFIAKGIIFRKSSTSRVSQALINDLNTKTVMMSDDLGIFTINTWIGDTLLITKKDYTPLKVVVADKNDLSIFLQPVVQLNQVTVKAESQKQELNDVMKQYKSEGIFNNGKSLPFWQALNSPLTEFYNLFGKTPGEAKRFAAYSKKELEAGAVDKRYTKELVKTTTKLPDEEVEKFMQYYRPSYQDIMQWNDYQLINAIKRNLVAYRRSKNRQPLQQLPRVNSPESLEDKKSE
ncbi:MAG TPA: hypothetical protein VG367_11730 [Mucilaginibacter sp.]|jgi:hypothetical protein|nr:hypothetical protein [Mucilaginibacter sp.]